MSKQSSPSRSLALDIRETPQFRREMRQKAQCQNRGPSGRFRRGYKSTGACSIFEEGERTKKRTKL